MTIITTDEELALGLGPEPGWIRCQPLADLPSMRNFVADDPGGERIRIVYYRAPDREGLYAKVWYGPGAEGPPRHAHGGALMAVMDEVMGGVVWLSGRRVVLARFESDMRSTVPLGVAVLVSGEILSVDGRKVRVRGEMRAADGALHVEALGLFVKLAPARLAELAGVLAAPKHDAPPTSAAT